MQLRAAGRVTTGLQNNCARYTMKTIQGHSSIRQKSRAYYGAEQNQGWNYELALLTKPTNIQIGKLIKVSEILKTDQLYRVEKRDIEKLNGLLTECFSKDPLYCQLIPEKKVRQKLLPELFSCDLDELFENCEIFADSKDLNGIIIVSDETEPYNPIKYYAVELYYALKSGAYLLRDGASLETLWNFIKGKEYLNSEWTEDIGTDRRMHIIYFAVRPSMRGKGIATKLMQTVIQYADAHRMALSLETHNEKNVGMYEHYGFRLFEIVQKHFALKQFCMVR